MGLCPHMSLCNSTKGGQKGRFFFIHIKRAIFKQGKGVENLVHMKYFLIKFGYDKFVRDNRIRLFFSSLISYMKYIFQMYISKKFMVPYDTISSTK